MSYYVKDYMDKDFPTIGVDSTVIEAAKKLTESTKGYVIVLKEGKPEGIITEWDLVSKVLAVEKDPQKVKVGEVMSSPLVTIDLDEDLLKASELMHKKNLKKIAVVKIGVIYGVITSVNIAQSCGDYVNKSVKDIMRWSFPPF